jgi:hypothetical protein
MPNVSPPASAFQGFALQEYARQYRMLTWVQFVGIFLLPAYLIGLIFIVYAMAQKAVLRRRAAEMGVDPLEWERPLRGHSTKIVLTGFVLTAFVLLSIGLHISRTMDAMERIDEAQAAAAP